VPDAAPSVPGGVVGSQLERLAQIASELGDEALAAEARAERDRLVDARFFVACLGQFKRGKSTLLNALVGRPILPVGVVPVTAVVTILRYGDEPAAAVRFSDGRSQPVALDAIAMFIDERHNPENRRHAAVVDVTLPSPILRDGLCLVDTPGLGSVHAANTEATRAFIPRTDVALVVVGPDPPISGAELQLIEEVDREAGELLVVLNKADQASAEQLREIIDFTRKTIEEAVARPVGPILEVSALERLTQEHPTRDWRELDTRLAQLSASARQRLVDSAGSRSVRRVSRRLRVEAARRDDALRRPISEIEARTTRLRVVLHDLDRSLLDLRFLFDAVESDLGRQFEQHRAQFFAGSLPQLQARLKAWVTEHHGSTGRSLRAQAFEEAHRLSVSAIEDWLRTLEPEADTLYRKTTERLVRLANEFLSRVESDAGDVEVDDLPSGLGFQTKRHFYFTSLMHVTAGSPATWLIDRFAPGGVRQAHIARDASAYLTHLLESNSHRVENDLKDRTLESRRWLEGQIRTRLTAALDSAERAVTLATEKQHLSELQVGERLQQVHSLREELAAIIES
jgi:GTPase SAR1 family protein